jgi:hypothetical protein
MLKRNFFSQPGKGVDVIEMVNLKKSFFVPTTSLARVNALFMQWYGQNWCSGMSSRCQ